jgi:4-hydroxyphenylpyruvate dioxygenase
VSITEPYELTDENGTVVLAVLKTYGDTVHTLVQRSDYKGLFMPGYIAHPKKEVMNTVFEPVNVDFIDHCVGNQPELEMEPTARWYEKMLDFHRFWSVDDSMMHTEFSALRSIVVCDFDEKVKMPINEPAAGKRKSQIQEYVDYWAGAGVQHIALNTPDLIPAIAAMRKRGVDFLEVPKTYYDNLRKNIPNMSITIKEDIDLLEHHKILIDYDDK